MVLRIIFIILANIYGLYGLAFGLIGLLLHLLNMKSYTIPYMQATMPVNPQDAKDTLIRAPWWLMRLRPRKMAQRDRVRMREDDNA